MITHTHSLTSDRRPAELRNTSRAVVDVITPRLSRRHGRTGGTSLRMAAAAAEGRGGGSSRPRPLTHEEGAGEHETAIN